MLGNRSILKNPPRVIDPDQRIKFGAIQALVGMAECGFDELRSHLALIALEDADKERTEQKDHRAMLLAWSIVDQADLLRHLISSEDESIQISEKDMFFEKIAVASQVRNWMRHIPQRVSGYRQRKQAMPPVLGVISFTHVVRASVPYATGDVIYDHQCLEYHTIILGNTAMERSAEILGEPTPYSSFKTPIDHVYLQAFGSVISLSEVVEVMGKFADALALAVQRWLDAKLAELSSQGIDTTSLTKPAIEPGNLRMVARRD